MPSIDDETGPGSGAFLDDPLVRRPQGPVLCEGILDHLIGRRVREVFDVVRQADTVKIWMSLFGRHPKNRCAEIIDCEGSEIQISAEVLGERGLPPAWRSTDEEDRCCRDVRPPGVARTSVHIRSRPGAGAQSGGEESGRHHAQGAR